MGVTFLSGDRKIFVVFGPPGGGVTVTLLSMELTLKMLLNGIRDEGAEKQITSHVRPNAD